jgi:ketosteroid isomerase-like protein
VTIEGTPREVVLELYRLWDEQGVEAALARVSPELEWIEPELAVGRESRRGVKDALENYESWTGSYEDYGGEVESVEDRGERVLVHFIQRGTPRGGSKPVEGSVYQLWTVRDGLAVRMQMFFDADAARAALYES